jgi:hypothetical protein
MRLEEMVMADMESMLAERAALTDEIATLAGRLGVILRREAELTEALRRELRAAGISAQPFLTQPNVREAICAELGKQGLHLHRVDPRISLVAVVEGQHRGVRGLVACQQRLQGPAAA